MVLEKLDNGLLSARIFCLAFFFFPLLMYIGNNHLVYTQTGFSLATLALQIVVPLAELMVPLCFGFAAPLPNRLGLSLLIVFLDFVAALLLMGSASGVIGVVNQKVHINLCLMQCKISLVYAVLALMGGAFGFISACCNTAVAVKMNIERQAQA